MNDNELAILALGLYFKHELGGTTESSEILARKIIDIASN